MLIDPGSELSFVSENLVKLLLITRQSSAIPLTGIGGTKSGSTRGIVSLTLSSTHQLAMSLTISAHVLKTLTTWLPSFSAANLWWSHLQGFPLADPDFLTPGAIDVILGADAYGQFIEPDVIKGEALEPIAQRSVFGRIVLGPVDDIAPSPATASYTVAVDHDLLELLSKFWLQEEVIPSSTSHLSADEAECEAHFRSTHTRDASGRYIVRLPLKSPASQLGDSKHSALGSCSLRRRLSADPKYEELYSTFIREYGELSHLTVAPSSDSDHAPVYYLPHHGVLKEQSLTTKLRVVFNGSAQTTSGVSLNDILHTGAKIQISDVLLWVRRHQFLIATDITKMFRQIKVHPDDWDLQRILWVDEQQNVTPYQLTTVTYGTRPAPFLAVRVLLQLAQDEGYKYPLAVPPLTRARYVDDIYGGSDDNLEEAEAIAHQLIALRKAGGFPLANWASNHPDLLKAVSPDNISSDSTHSFEDSRVKILGLSWHPQADQFKFHASLSTATKITKRVILSEVAQLYDPLGFLSPVIVRAKILLQELWLVKLDWDDSPSPQTCQRWLKFRKDLSDLSHLSIPRWLYLTTTARVELHGFSDASQLAIAAAVYIKVISSESESTISLVCAKTKVAPLKPLTIPRLKLTAAHCGPGDPKNWPETNFKIL